jgi:diadenosine tetraphosphatase ApaH/serine/threonine PP2A family protein phosphatase
LQNADLYSGLSKTLDQIEDFHPPEVVEALFRGALQREGEVSVHFAAMLMFVHGKAKEPFDWEQRPFFLRFHTENRAERAAAFQELCEKIGVDASAYLR